MTIVFLSDAPDDVLFVVGPGVALTAVIFLEDLSTNDGVAGSGTVFGLLWLLPPTPNDPLTSPWPQTSPPEPCFLGGVVGELELELDGEDDIWLIKADDTYAV
mmetsp:Transcript_58662/g.143466  ORF Transcript_58662/g.143466 Transcript_58662/m.143466 type:complete len:103 (-) Transcript_58662:108-416(-)